MPNKPITEEELVENIMLIGWEIAMMGDPFKSQKENVKMQNDKYDKEVKKYAKIVKNLVKAGQQALNVGQLRQWLNEERITDSKKMITNEDILVFINQRKVK